MLSSIFKNSPHSLCLRAFYLLNMLALMDFKGHIYAKLGMTAAADWLWPVMWLNRFPLDSPLLFFYYFAILACLLAVIFPHFIICRILAGLGWMFVLSATFSFGDVSHSLFPHMTVAFLCILETTANAFRFFEWGRVFCLTMYFNASVWKIRALLTLPGDGWWSEVSQIMPFHIARGIADGSLASWSLMEFLNHHPALSALLWFLTIAVQFSTIIWIFYPQLNWLWVTLIFVFHFGAAFSLGVEFDRFLPLVIFLFLVAPAFRALTPATGRASAKRGSSN